MPAPTPGVDARRIAARPAGSARQRPLPPRGPGLPGVPPRQPRRVPELGAIRGQPPPPRATPRRGPVPGPARATVAVLAGLVVCGECGCRMQTHYARTLRYVCRRRAMDYGERTCQSLAGAALEGLVRDQVLEVITPAGLELSRRGPGVPTRPRRPGSSMAAAAGAGGPGSRSCLPAVQRRRAGEPPGGADAGTAVGRGPAVTAEPGGAIPSVPANATRAVEPAECAWIEALSGDIPALWAASTTTVEEKRRVVRLLLQRVVVFSRDEYQQVKVQLHWTGGTVTEHRVSRTVHSWEQVADAATVYQRVRSWHAAGWTSRRSPTN